MNKKYEDFQITLLSQFYFSVLIEKEKETDEPLKLILNIKDEMDDINTKKEFEINQVDFICEAQILKINYKEYQESLKVINMIEKNLNDKNKIILNKENCNSESNISDNYPDEDNINNHKISDILKNLSFMKNISKIGKLKVINVDGVNKNFELI